MAELYSKKVMDIFKNPKHIGEIKNPSGVGKVGNPLCGDVMLVYLKIEKTKGEEFIKDIKIKTFGCVAAITTSSIMAELVKGKKLSKAEKLSQNDIILALGGLPSIKKHCSDLALSALKKAIEDYKSK